MLKQIGYLAISMVKHHELSIMLAEILRRSYANRRFPLMA